MGCVRLTVKNAKWIYDNCATGTLVKFYEDSNPGPLGKPSEQKISSETEYRNWDPTDPDPNNPWKDYGKEEQPAEENVENTTQDVNNSQIVENVEESTNEESIENSDTADNEESIQENEQANTEDEKNIQVNKEDSQNNYEEVI